MNLQLYELMLDEAEGHGEFPHRDCHANVTVMMVVRYPKGVYPSALLL